METHDIILIATTALLVLAAGYAWHSRRIRRLNRQLRHAQNQLRAYRNALIKTDQPQPAQSAGKQQEKERAHSEDEHLFVEMDKRVTADRLFLNPELGRDELMQLLGIEKNRFGRMMARYSDASNVSVYINTKRVEYAVQLMRQFPNHTIASIATDCGMKNTVTFNRVFKEVYGMTPSEWKSVNLNDANGGGKTAAVQADRAAIPSEAEK